MWDSTRAGMTFAVIALAGIALGCKTTGEESTDPDTDVTGIYHLISIEGNPIPYAPMHLGRRQPQVVAGTITLHDGGTFASTMEYANDAGKTMSRAFAGTYTMDGAEFILSWAGAGRTRATIEENTFTMNNEGMLFVYEK
ncbi:MAG: hypothetical protein DHS20C16_35050 [Phycisphaerae bacterium]|nr:MAG: hypothetical protein DHS20C16_35050 [Phycisphaerae bacterium]